MSAMCGCRPGTYENGWHEQRSALCHQAEMDAWSQAIKRGREWRTENLPRLAAQIHN